MAEVITGPASFTAGSRWTIVGTGFGATEGYAGLRFSGPSGVIGGVTLEVVSWSDTEILVEAATLQSINFPVTSANVTCEVSVLADGSNDGDYHTLTYLPPAGYTSVDVPTATWADAEHSIFRCLRSTGPFNVAGSTYHQVVYQTSSNASASITVDSAGVIDTSSPELRRVDGFTAFVWLQGINAELIEASYWWPAEAEMLARLAGQLNFNPHIGTRIYRNHSPQNAALPYLVLHRISAQRESAFGSDPGHVHALFQLSAFASSAAVARGACDSARAALQRYRAPPIEDIFVLDETELYERDTNKFGHAIDLMVHYRE